MMPFYRGYFGFDPTYLLVIAGALLSINFSVLLLFASVKTEFNKRVIQKASATRLI